VKVARRFTFEAAHRLPGHPGHCDRYHGHSYKLVVFAEGPVDQSTGMVIDFGDLDRLVKEVIISRVDHMDLTELFPFHTTVENLATWILISLLEHDERICKLQLWETENSYVELTVEDLMAQMPDVQWLRRLQV
jgi:6-pyruvoyltetrahydropterin/6-carboxytetrahydropterin synthase